MVQKIGRLLSRNLITFILSLFLERNLDSIEHREKSSVQLNNFFERICIIEDSRVSFSLDSV